MAKKDIKYKEFISEIGMRINRDTYKILKYSVDNDKPVLLIGETGTGKTSMVQNYGKLMDKKVHRINLNGQTSIDEIVGRWLLKDKKTVWQDGILINAMKKGDWIVFDEINAALPEVMFVLHSLLDHDKSVTLVEKDNEVVIPHKDFRLFATMNPGDRYPGTKTLNPAFKSRFPSIIIMNYCEQEKEILMSRTDVKESDASKLVNIAKEIRNMYYGETVNYPCSTRDILYAAEMTKPLGLKTAIKVSIINKAEEEERPALLKMIELLTGDKLIVDDETSYKSVEELISGLKGTKEQVKDLLKERGEDKEQINELEKQLVAKTDEIQTLGSNIKSCGNINDIVVDEIAKAVKKKLK